MRWRLSVFSFAGRPDCGYAMQVQALAEILAVGRVGNKSRPQPVQPEQRFFTQRIDMVNLFDIEDGGRSRTEITSDPHEFFRPVSR